MSGYMDRLTELTKRERRSLIYFFASLSSEEQLTIIERQAEIINWKRKEMTKTERTEFYLSTLVLAIKDSKEKRKQSKRRTATPAELAGVDRQRIEYLKRQNPRSPERDFLVRHAGLLRQLREKDHLSWRLVCDYLKKYHGRDISISYVRKVFKSLFD